jgi:hypothetical protein
MNTPQIRMPSRAATKRPAVSGVASGIIATPPTLRTRPD